MFIQYIEETTEDIHAQNFFIYYLRRNLSSYPQLVISMVVYQLPSGNTTGNMVIFTNNFIICIGKLINL